MHPLQFLADPPWRPPPLARHVGRAADWQAPCTNASLSFLMSVRGRTQVCSSTGVYVGECFDYIYCREAAAPGSLAVMMQRVLPALQAAYVAERPPPASRNRWAGVTHVVVHVRRGDVAHRRERFRLYMGDPMLAYFERTMNGLRAELSGVGDPTLHAPPRHLTRPARFTVITDASDSDGAVWRTFRNASDVYVRKGGNLVDDFDLLVHADVLVLSLSSFSFAAAWLARGAVVAPSCMSYIGDPLPPPPLPGSFGHLPLPHWRRSPCCPTELRRSPDQMFC